MTSDEADERIRFSVQRLHEWRWMSTLSTRPADLLCQLREEAKLLINIGVEHPRKTTDIGLVVVAYHRLIETVKTSNTKRAEHAA